MRPTVSRSLTPWRVSGRAPPPGVLSSGHTRVVARAEFEEREYETACTVELSSNAYGFGPQLWSAGTVFEKILGYDVAVGVSSSNALWQVLGVPRPNGVQLLPKMWAPGPRPPVQRLPAHPVSMILQYKRPEYMHGPRAAQWARWHRPYYRISRSSYQHRVLRQLEARVGPDVVVRYAAPAFHTYAELDLARFAGQVLTDSGFVSPSALGGHQVWTYQSPGTVGYPNPSGAGWEFEGIRGLFTVVQESPNLGLPRTNFGELEPADPFGDHLQRLGDAFRYRQPGLRDAVGQWATRLLGLPDLQLQPTTFRAVVNAVTIQSGADRLGATWHVASDLE